MSILSFSVKDIGTTLQQSLAGNSFCQSPVTTYKVNGERNTFYIISDDFGHISLRQGMLKDYAGYGDMPVFAITVTELDSSQSHPVIVLMLPQDYETVEQACEDAVKNIVRISARFDKNILRFTL